MAAPNQTQANPLCLWCSFQGCRWSEDEIAVKPACSASCT